MFVQTPCLIDIVVHALLFLQLVVVEEVGSLLEGEFTVMTASGAVVGIMVVAEDLLEMSMGAGVISRVEVGVLLGVVKVISQAEGEEAVWVEQGKMSPHETLWGEFWHPFLTVVSLVCGNIKGLQVIKS